jgi:hypothetical protein
MFNGHIDYFENIGLHEQVNEAHLVMIGKLMGVPRITVFTPDFFDSLFLFTTEKVHPYATGFAFNKDDSEGGGLFGYTFNDTKDTTRTLPSNDYLKVLRFMAEQPRGARGLIFIDKIINHYFREKVVPEMYAFEYVSEQGLDDEIGIGDYILKIASNDAYTMEVVRKLLAAFYATVPRVHIKSSLVT